MPSASPNRSQTNVLAVVDIIDEAVDGVSALAGVRVVGTEVPSLTVPATRCPLTLTHSVSLWVKRARSSLVDRLKVCSRADIPFVLEKTYPVGRTVMRIVVEKEKERSSIATAAVLGESTSAVENTVMSESPAAGESAASSDISPLVGDGSINSPNQEVTVAIEAPLPSSTGVVVGGRDRPELGDVDKEVPAIVGRPARLELGVVKAVVQGLVTVEWERGGESR